MRPVEWMSPSGFGLTRLASYGKARPGPTSCRVTSRMAEDERQLPRLVGVDGQGHVADDDLVHPDFEPIAEALVGEERAAPSLGRNVQLHPLHADLVDAHHRLQQLAHAGAELEGGHGEHGLPVGRRAFPIEIQDAQPAARHLQAIEHRHMQGVQLHRRAEAVFQGGDDAVAQDRLRVANGVVEHDNEQDRQRDRCNRQNDHPGRQPARAGRRGLGLFACSGLGPILVHCGPGILVPRSV